MRGPSGLNVIVILMAIVVVMFDIISLIAVNFWKITGQVCRELCVAVTV